MAAAAADAFFTYKIIHTQYRLFGLGTLLLRREAAAAKMGDKVRRDELLSGEFFESLTVEDDYSSPARFYNAEIPKLVDLAAYDDTRRAEAVCYLLMRHDDRACF